MRGLTLCLLCLMFAVAGCCSDCSNSSTESQSSSEECPTGGCCSIKSRAEMLRQQQQTKKTSQDGE